MDVEKSIECPILAELRNERDQLKITVRFLTKNNTDLLARYANDTKALREEVNKLNEQLGKMQIDIAQTYELISKYEKMI